MPATAVDSAAPDDEPITPIPQPPAADPLKVRLGERLFQDPRLSRGNVRSCSTCHNLGGNGASTNVHETALDGSPLSFNTGTVFNAALSFRLGWEGKYRTLESQNAALLSNPQVMDCDPATAAAKLRQDVELSRLFQAVYGHPPDADSLLNALATFERTLVTPSGRFDRWLAGDKAALSGGEVEGYRLFKSLGCTACHQGVNVGGNLFERHGIFHPLARRDPVILRVPSLRNIAATGPYFHDGSTQSLHDAVRQMARAQLDDNLTDAQVEEIVSFLRSLSGQYRGRLIETSQGAPQL
jgi:cytochrome c peroxidase